MLEVNNIGKMFYRSFFDRKAVQVLSNVTFSVASGQMFGIMGESGSGKSTLARILTRIIKPTVGQIFYQGVDLAALTHRQSVVYRRKIQMIFQQPLLALDPRQTIVSALLEPLLTHKLVKSRYQAFDKINELLYLTNLTEDILPRYPCQISGGQAQRVVIARVLSLEPEVIIADEPTAMLDISVQAQIINLLQQIRKKKGVSVVLISHDEAIIRACCDQALILHQGKVMAVGNPATILGSAQSDILSLAKQLVRR